MSTGRDAQEFKAIGVSKRWLSSTGGLNLFFQLSHRTLTNIPNLLSVRWFENPTLLERTGWGNLSPSPSVSARVRHTNNGVYPCWNTDQLRDWIPTPSSVRFDHFVVFVSGHKQRWYTCVITLWTYFNQSFHLFIAPHVSMQRFSIPVAPTERHSQRHTGCFGPFLPTTHFFKYFLPLVYNLVPFAVTPGTNCTRVHLEMNWYPAFRWTRVWMSFRPAQM